MRPKTTKYTRLNKDLQALKIGESLAHALNLEMRQAAYAAQKLLGIKICAQNIPLKKNRFQVTRTA